MTPTIHSETAAAKPALACVTRMPCRLAAGDIDGADVDRAATYREQAGQGCEHGASSGVCR